MTKPEVGIAAMREVAPQLAEPWRTLLHGLADTAESAAREARDDLLVRIIDSLTEHACTARHHDAAHRHWDADDLWKVLTVVNRG